MTEEKKEAKPKPPKGKPIVNVIDDWCKGCGFCVDACPKKVLALSKRFNPKGYHPPDVVLPDECTGCENCRMMCPEFSIFITRQAKDKE